HFGPSADGPARTSEAISNLSLVQCELTGGQYLTVPGLLRQIWNEHVDDPLAATIDAYLALREQRYDELLAKASRLTETAGQREGLVPKEIPLRNGDQDTDRAAYPDLPDI